MNFAVYTKQALTALINNKIENTVDFAKVLSSMGIYIYDEFATDLPSIWLTDLQLHLITVLYLSKSKIGLTPASINPFGLSSWQAELDYLQDNHLILGDNGYFRLNDLCSDNVISIGELPPWINNSPSESPPFSPTPSSSTASISLAISPTLSTITAATTSPLTSLTLFSYQNKHEPKPDYFGLNDQDIEEEKEFLPLEKKPRIPRAKKENETRYTRKEKIDRRKEQNRQAAATSRRKKQESIAGKDNLILQLKAEVESLKEENSQLKGLLEFNGQHAGSRRYNMFNRDHEFSSSGSSQVLEISSPAKKSRFSSS